MKNKKDFRQVASNVLKQQGIKEELIPRFAGYISQELNDAFKLGGPTEAGRRALKHETRKAPNAKPVAKAMQQVWLTYYGDLPKSQQDTPSIKAVYSEISKRNIGNIVKEGFSVTSKADDMQIRKPIDVEPDTNPFKGEVDSNKTAGLRPDQVKNKEKLVPKDIKSNVSSKQGAIWEEAKNYGVDPKVEQRAKARRNAEIDLRPALGTEKLSRFVRRKQMKFKPTKQARGQKGADLGALVSGQKILE